MQIFKCPFCGPRDEREFRFAGEAGKTRPDTTADVTDQAWRDYLYAAINPMGEAREIWVHLPCQEYFIMTRHTGSMEVLRVEMLRKSLP